MCGIDRTKTIGYCKSPSAPKIARAASHMWEEPCISGWHGSGTIFFSGCTLRCCFCQNYQISQEGFGMEISIRRLSQIFLELQEKGAHNINLVTPTHYVPSIIQALDMVSGKLSVPVVYNSSGYERIETLALLRNYIDIYLPDIKYWDSEISARYSNARNYFYYAQKAVSWMIEQTGPAVFDNSGNGLMKKGVILRHMVLPGHKEDSIRLLHWMKESLPPGQFYISLLSQYTPCYHSSDFKTINRRITSYEYQKVVETALDLGLHTGYMQKKSSAKEEYTPNFNLDGVMNPSSYK